ncbi:MAG: serine/threonine-protein kinase, partial [Polyangiaceae bacterium]
MVDPAPSVHVGDVLAGKYEVVGHIGEGGMGYVFEGVHRGLNQRVAIKVLQRRKGHDDELIARFEREARAAAKLQSEHTARVMDVDTLADGTPFMVMELLEGHDLEAELCRFGKLPVVEAVDIVLQACSAMAEAHQRGIVHRDLKPPNLFLCERGGVVTVKLLDFGISKMVTEEDKSVTQTSSSLGTPLYMSPEQIRSAKHVDARTDIWSLGVILYELIAGTTPFEADSPTAVIAAITADTPRPLAQTGPDVPVPLSEVVMK